MKKVIQTIQQKYFNNKIGKNINIGKILPVFISSYLVFKGFQTHFGKKCYDTDFDVDFNDNNFGEMNDDDGINEEIF